MRILVLGAGMYVTGRVGTGTGTVLASLAEISRRTPIERVTVAARSAGNAAHVAEAARRINATIGSTLNAAYERLTPERSLPDLLRAEAYDAAIVSVPDPAHYEAARALLEAGVPSLVVKPLTPTLAEARSLVQISRERGCYGAVEFHKRFDETNLYARKAIENGVLGQLLYITVDYSQRISIPTVVFKDWARHTNIFQYLAVHYVDLIHFLTGWMPTRAMAIGTHGALRHRGVSEFDSVHATIVWRNPADSSQELVSQFSMNWIDPDRSSALSDQKYKIIGTSGRLELDQKNRGVELVTQTDGVQAINPYFSEFLPDAACGTTFSGYGLRSIERFVLDVVDLRLERVRFDDLERTRPSFLSALPSVAVTEAVNASLARNSHWVSISEIL
jgi:predicted dehydrogenase